MLKESFAKNIQRLRKVRGWSQQKLADEAGVSYHTVFRAEAGTMPKIENLQKISKALGISESELLGNIPPTLKTALTPETLEAIREATKEAIKETLAGSGSKADDPKAELFSLINGLSPEMIRDLTDIVRGFVESTADNSQVTRSPHSRSK